eukprot:1176377-Prorocentrum_minimum.AAC.2
MPRPARAGCDLAPGSQGALAVPCGPDLYGRAPPAADSAGGRFLRGRQRAQPGADPAVQCGPGSAGQTGRPSTAARASSLATDASAPPSPGTNCADVWKPFYDCVVQASPLTRATPERHVSSRYTYMTSKGKFQKEF